MGDRSIIEILESLYAMATASEITVHETAEHISFEDYQALIADDLAELSYLLGVNLDNMKIEKERIYPTIEREETK